MARLDGDPGADTNCGVRAKHHALQGEDVVAQVFPGMRNLRDPGVGMKELDSKHGSILAERAGVFFWQKDL